MTDKHKEQVPFFRTEVSKYLRDGVAAARTELEGLMLLGRSDDVDHCGALYVEVNTLSRVHEALFGEKL